MGEQSDLRKRRVVDLLGKRDSEGLHSIFRGNAGSVLLVLVVTMVILAALTAALLPTLFTTEMEQVSASGAMKAYYLAEAGGRYTLPRLRDIAVGTHTFRFSGILPYFQITKVSNTRFTSTGVVSGGTDLEARVTIAYRSACTFDYALFADGSITLKKTAVVDSYSSAGYPTDLKSGNVGTNSDNLSGVAADATISGEREVSVGKDMTPEALPAGWPWWTNYWQLSWGLSDREYDLGPGDYRTSALNIGDRTTVNITGDVVLYVQGTTTFSDSSTLNIEHDASLTIYAGGNAALANNTLVYADYIPEQFIIYGLAGCGSITVGTGSELYAAIYAPLADITMANGAEVYGSLIGDTINATNNADIHYDEDLQDVGSSNIEQYFD